MISSQKTKPYKIFFEGKNLTLWLRWQDFPMFDEVFFYQNYQVPSSWLPEKSTFADLGAHVGLVSCYFFAKYDTIEQFYCIEPSTKNQAVLMKNLDNITTPNTLIKKAIADDNTDFVFFDQSDISYNHKTTTANGEKIPATSVNHFFNTYNIVHCNVLKMDIEGAEKVVFNASDLSWLDKTDRVILELHDDFDLPTLSTIVAAKKFSAHYPTQNLQMNYLERIVRK